MILRVWFQMEFPSFIIIFLRHVDCFYFLLAILSHHFVCVYFSLSLSLFPPPHLSLSFSIILSSSLPPSSLSTSIFLISLYV